MSRAVQLAILRTANYSVAQAVRVVFSGPRHPQLPGRIEQHGLQGTVNERGKIVLKRYYAPCLKKRANFISMITSANWEQFS